MQVADGVEQGLGHRPHEGPAPIDEPAKVDRLFQLNLERRQRVVLLRADEEPVAARDSPRRDRSAQADRDQPLAFLADDADMGHGIGGNGRRQKILVLYGGPLHLASAQVFLVGRRFVELAGNVRGRPNEAHEALLPLMDPEVCAQREGRRAAHTGRLDGQVHEVAAVVKREALRDLRAGLRIRIRKADLAGGLLLAEPEVFSRNRVHASRQPLLQFGIEDLHGQRRNE